MNLKPTVVLLVEDDDSISEPLVFGLEAEGFRVFAADDGPQGLATARIEQPDVVLLDVMLPGMDGFTLCKILRQESAVPILMLTSRGQEMDKVFGLELGADDYIVKPFSFRELLARIRAILRRRALEQGKGSPSADRLVIGNIKLDRTARQAWRAGQPVELRQREFGLLSALMDRSGEAVSRQELLDEAWGKNWIGDPHTLDVHIRWLREKLEDDPSSPSHILTVRGYGYRMAESDAAHTKTP